MNHKIPIHLLLLSWLVAVAAPVTGHGATCARSRVTSSPLPIAHTLVQIAEGAIKTEAIDFAGDGLLAGFQFDRSSAQLWVDEKPRKLQYVFRDRSLLADRKLRGDELAAALTTIMDVHDRMWGWIKDRRHEGSLAYAYGGWLGQNRLERYTHIQDDRLYLRAELCGKMERLTWACIEIWATEAQGTTTIAGTITAFAPTRCCIVSRIAERRVMPPLIDDELARIELRCRELAVAGKGGLHDVLNECVMRVHQRGLGYRSP